MSKCDCVCILDSTRRSCRLWISTFVTYERIFGPTEGKNKTFIKLHLPRTVQLKPPVCDKPMKRRFSRSFPKHEKHFPGPPHHHHAGLDVKFNQQLVSSYLEHLSPPIWLLSLCSPLSERPDEVWSLEEGTKHHVCSSIYEST